MQLLQARLEFHPASLVSLQGTEFGLLPTSHGSQLAILDGSGAPVARDFEGEGSEYNGKHLVFCPLSPPNAAALRKHLPWLTPQRLGLRTSAGMGDRLGIATPGHVRACQAIPGELAPIFAQQSMREMQRTGRSPQQVMDDATWGIFQEGWRGGVGADADHLKTTQDIDGCLAAGFTLFTLDPGQYVDDQVSESSLTGYPELLDRLPRELQPESTGLLGKTFDIEGYSAMFDRPVLAKAVLKYGKAVAYTVELYNHLQNVGGQSREVEISMDETELPTCPEEHIYIASELRRHGVQWVSFAPRFVGSFEKGVDYIGDLAEFESQLAIHAAIARQYGPYKLSLHSGSDKFSIYPMFVHHTRGLAHLKTAGTSYLEGLRTVAAIDVQLFKEIYQFSRHHFDTDRLSYHISARLDRTPEPIEVSDWPALLDQFDARQVLHVTFGSVLTERKPDGTFRFYDRLMALLAANRELYYSNLVAHFRRHLAPFSAG